MKKHYILTGITLLLITLPCCNRVDERESNFDNVAYIAAAENVDKEELNLKNTDYELQRVIQAALALPEEQDIHVTYKVDLSLVERYGKIHMIEYTPLPETFFELSDNNAVIPAGGVRSSDVILKFVNLQDIPKGVTFLLPVTLESATNVNILNGSRTMYYEIKKGAPIVVAANINKTHLELENPASATALKNLTAVTMEALIRPHEWGTDAGISSVMGIENYFLIRIGDSGFPTEQIQISKASGYGGNWPASDNSKRLKKNVWQHIALTFDLATREMVLYVDGKVQSRGTQSGTTGTLTLSPTSGNLFYIGKSWNDERPLRGEICEARIWSVVRTQDEINASKYFVDETTPGLAAYWKFDEGEGNNITDYSGNGNHMKVGLTEGAINNITWVPVQLGLE
jgi:hypothetical protein